MSLFGNLIIRAIAVLIGYTLAMIATGIFLSFGLFTESVRGFFEGMPNAGQLENGSIIFIGIYVSFAAARLAFFPAVITIAIAELMRWRGLTVNLVLGGLCALFAGLTRYPIGTAARPSDTTLIILLACGFIGGFVYWLIAGRRAGSWMPAKATDSDA